METFVFKRQITGFRQNIPEQFIQQSKFNFDSPTFKIVGVEIKRKISEYKISGWLK